ncbi:carbohydrate ABC transporter membrane protein 1, CUT1 family [Consotaella salsifontis]|uniref:Carbohydrate ABC transporter membrane protein 1, CUT1 family n=2 Tax=Consotaella salsifontis TaxID=1365950 RepID=A0A1T4MPR3_9HYPH|nr:carbohydrate ABC transporter membrane protein 1, CUT1 family [Consotaella salsifontis]
MTTRPRRLRMATFVVLPAWALVLAAYVGTMVWTMQISFTDSKLLPVDTYVGFDQYERLFSSTRWLVSLQNVAIFGVLFIAGSLVVGFLLAVALDQHVRFENTLRTIFLYPYAMSFIVTGLIWQWLMNPGLGIQKAVQNWGWESFRFDWAVNREMAIYAVVIAGIWQASGLVMALMLAGLRGIDADLWKATRIEGIPPWRVYLFIIVPMLRPLIITAVVLLSIGVVKAFDLVVALTSGGPGIASEVPAKFIMDYLFTRQNIGLATAAATVMLITVASVLTPWLYFEYFRKARPRGAA